MTHSPLLHPASRPHWTPHECAGGLLASPAAPTPIDRAVPPVPHADRRATLKGMLGLGLAAVATAATRPLSATPPIASAMVRSQASATPVLNGLIGYAFNAKTQNVTLFDPVTHQVLRTEPLGAAVRWLSNEQQYWDGQYVWTYDFPEDRVQAIAIDPEVVSVARTVPTNGTGPAHSLMLTPDRTTAWVNVAGDDSLAVLDLASGEVVDNVPTGKFPWDVHFTPDGRFGFTPERDQDTVSKFDLASRKIVKTVEFPEGSKPYMLRVNPDGKDLWVLTASANTNVVLDPESMEVLHTEPIGRSPVQCAFGPAGGRYGLVMHLEDDFVLVLDQETGRTVQRIEVGGPQANASFLPDGTTAYVTVTGRNEVVAIDMVELAVVARIAAGEEPMGLVVFDPTAP